MLRCLHEFEGLPPFKGYFTLLCKGSVTICTSTTTVVDKTRGLYNGSCCKKKNTHSSWIEINKLPGVPNTFFRLVALLAILSIMNSTPYKYKTICCTYYNLWYHIFTTWPQHGFRWLAALDNFKCITWSQSDEHDQLHSIIYSSTIYYTATQNIKCLYLHFKVLYML